MNKIRYILWRILGFDYKTLLKKTDYILLKDDKFTNIGKRSYDNGALVWRWTNAEINIGKFCSIANNVRFIVDEGYHNSSEITSFPLISNLFKEDIKLPDGRLKEDILKNLKQKEGINIGNDVWLGMGAYIMPGVSIGNGVTIGANSVVTKDLPDYVIAAGSPAKIIKYKHDEDTIKKLNKIAWWNWDEQLIKEQVSDFYISINDFINKYNY